MRTPALPEEDGLDNNVRRQTDPAGTISKYSTISLGDHMQLVRDVCPKVREQIRPINESDGKPTRAVHLRTICYLLPLNPYAHMGSKPTEHEAQPGSCPLPHEPIP